MSIIGKLLGSTDVIKAGMDLIDDMHTSKEEEIEAKTKAKTDLLAAYAPFKVAQRYIALIFGLNFTFSFFLILGMTLAKIGDVAAAREVILEFKIGWIMLTIVGFYFGGGAFEGVKKAVAK